VGAAPDPRQGPALRGPQGGALLPALRHGALVARAGAGLQGRRRPVGLRPLPGRRGRRAAAGRRRAAGVDDDAVDAGLQRGGRGRSGADLRAGQDGDAGGAGRAGGGAGRARPRHRPRGPDPRQVPGRGARRRPLRPALHLHQGRGVRRARPHRPARRLRHGRGRHRSRAHRDRLRRGRLPPRRAVRPEGRQPRRARRHLRRAHQGLRGPLRQGRRRGAGRGPARARPAAARPGVRAQLPALLALRHAAALLRQAVVVHRDLAGQGPAAGRQRDRRLASRARQARALRPLAGEQRRLGAVARSARSRSWSS
jgi:hypothetical protein